MPSISHVPEVSQRIVAMLQKGEIHSSVALQLLGGLAPGDGNESKEKGQKRPLENRTDGEPPNSENPDQAIEDLLAEAKTAKMET